MNGVRKLGAAALIASTLLFGVSAGIAALRTDDRASPIHGVELPEGYRDWKLVSVAQENGRNNDIRAIVGNDIAVRAFRDGTRPFPTGRSSSASPGDTNPRRATTRSSRRRSRSWRGCRPMCRSASRMRRAMPQRGAGATASSRTAARTPTALSLSPVSPVTRSSRRSIPARIWSSAPIRADLRRHLICRNENGRSCRGHDRPGVRAGTSGGGGSRRRAPMAWRLRAR
ncbi:Cytochrome P460 [Sphingopyxis terrae subsp. ummariensis]|uniref:Cytochrome P460 n=1 Tax=Sphingopyxis terrae subsp. ummariensis TaxID=429001 RepID=A0A1Y6FN73_9SPHN|nr:Cytochrome P460 [Sphingopyxis terrae subsp. ummariensis]